MSPFPPNNVRRILALCAIAALSAALISCAPEQRLSESGFSRTADLQNADFSGNTILRLDGNWHFWPERLLSDAEVRQSIAEGNSGSMSVPGHWSKLGLFEDAARLAHTGTLALKLRLPPGNTEWAIRLPNAHTACALIINGQEVARIGKVGETAELTVPRNGLKVIPFSAADGEVLLILQIANFATPYTGTWDSPLLGTNTAITAKRNNDIIFTALTSGAMIFMGLYHLALFLLRRKDKSTLLFGLICLMMSIRNLMMGERILIGLFPETPGGWQLAFIVEHLSAHLTLPLFFLFFGQLFPRQIHRLAIRVVIAVSGLWALLEITTPAMLHHRLLSSFEYFLLISALYIFASLIRALYHREEGALTIMGGILILIFTVINDVLLSNGIIESFYMSSLGLFFFTFSQSFFLSLRFSRLFQIVERYALELQTLNHSLERFIPHEVLGYLDKKSIIDVNLGDFSEQHMSVFFLDIRDFTTLSEAMTPSENFLFINSFLEKFGPLVRQNGGFIDKYLGDGFMALFPGKSDNALNAAVAMRRMLRKFNTEHRTLAEPVRFGIGIHYGKLMLGTIGENQRMDSTVISDTVNTASRLEQLTKTQKTDILLSSETVENLSLPDAFPLQHIGHEKVKGRAKTVTVYAVADTDTEEPEELRSLD